MLKGQIAAQRTASRPDKGLYRGAGIGLQRRTQPQQPCRKSLLTRIPKSPERVASLASFAVQQKVALVCRSGVSSCYHMRASCRAKHCRGSSLNVRCGRKSQVPRQFVQQKAQKIPRQRGKRCHCTLFNIRCLKCGIATCSCSLHSLSLGLSLQHARQHLVACFMIAAETLEQTKRVLKAFLLQRLPVLQPVLQLFCLVSRSCDFRQSSTCNANKGTAGIKLYSAMHAQTIPQIHRLQRCKSPEHVCDGAEWPHAGITPQAPHQVVHRLQILAACSQLLCTFLHLVGKSKPPSAVVHQPGLHQPLPKRSRH